MNIAQHVHFENEVIKYENILASSVPDQFTPFIGQKVVKAQPELIKKIKDSISIPDFTPQPLPGGFATLRGPYFSIHSYSFSLKFDICFSGGKYEDRSYYCFYAKGYVYIGELNNQILTKVNTPKQQELINLVETLENIEKYHALIDKAEKVKDSIRLDFNLYKKGY